MADFAGIAAEIRTLQLQTGNKQGAAQKAEDALKAKNQELIDWCKPYCAAAIERYNARGSLKIMPEGIGLSFNLEQQKLLLHVRLKKANGREPDECLGSNEVKAISQKLSRLLNPQLSKAGIPLTLDEIQVPYHYYPK